MDSIKQNRNTHKAQGRRKRNEHSSQKGDRQADLGEQLCNGGESGPIKQVQLAEAEITSLRGIMLDLDPRLFRPEIVTNPTRANPNEFYTQLVSKWLSHHPVLRKAEVRNSGNGLHVILRLDQPLEFQTEGELQRWSAIIRALQRLLPTDPHCPGITALTRPIGSVNSKGGNTVACLHEGERITLEEITGLFEQVRSAPFRTVATILFGRDRLVPCPLCRKEESRLDALDQFGNCYGQCGKVRLGQLFDLFLQPRPKKES